MADKKKGTITSRSAKANVKARTQQRHKNLLEGRGIETSVKPKVKENKRPKVSRVSSVQSTSQRPKNKPYKDTTSGVKSVGIRKRGAKQAAEAKRKQQLARLSKASGTAKAPQPKVESMKSPNKKGGGKRDWVAERAAAKQTKKFDKAARLRKRADEAGKDGNTKKAARLQKRSQRMTERGRGERKSTAGTALKGLGLGLGRGLARLGGYGGKFKKGQASYKKPNAASKTPLGNKFRVVSKAADEDEK